jgi:hypothetical protein
MKILLFVTGVFAFALFAIGGTIMCNYVLAEFLGPSAPQPSILGWTGFWAIMFVVSNMHLDLDWEKLVSYLESRKS